MLIYTRCRVLLPERITKQKGKLTEPYFLLIIKNYLIKGYQNYKLIRFEDGFAICDRIDDVQERRKKK